MSSNGIDESKEYVGRGRVVKVSTKPIKLPYPRAAEIELNITTGVYKIVGLVSGTVYEFHGLGARQLVDPKDSPGLLARTKREGCCGSPEKNKPVFKLIRFVY